MVPEGVKIKRINANIGPVRHRFRDVPTFVIDEKVYSGYKTFDELKELLSCSSKEENQLSQNENQKQSLSEVQFFGEKGESVNLENGEVKLVASTFSDNQARFYNIEMPDGKTIYFFVVKDKNGIYRAAANACAVCLKKSPLKKADVIQVRSIQI